MLDYYADETPEAAMHRSDCEDYAEEIRKLAGKLQKVVSDAEGSYNRYREITDTRPDCWGAMDCPKDMLDIISGTFRV